MCYRIKVLCVVASLPFVFSSCLLFDSGSRGSRSNSGEIGSFEAGPMFVTCEDIAGKYTDCTCNDTSGRVILTCKACTDFPEYNEDNCTCTENRQNKSVNVTCDTTKKVLLCGGTTCLSTQQCVNDACVDNNCNDSCVSGQHCDIVSNTCVADETTTSCSGQTCTASQYCDVGSNQCLSKKAYNVVCASSSECKSGVCLNGYCKSDCTKNAPTCDGTEYCDTTSLTCKDKLDDGASCSVNAQCTSGTCDPARKLCSSPVVTKTALGLYCPNNEACASGWCDTNSKCALYPGRDACDRTNAAYCPISGECQDGKCRLGLGAVCSNNDQCKKGGTFGGRLCFEGRCKLESGEACSDYESHCAYGDCSKDEFFSPFVTCGISTGEACTNNLECKSRSCLLDTLFGMDYNCN